MKKRKKDVSCGYGTSSFLLSFYEIVQQSLAGIFQERDNELEVAVVAVVWIGHHAVDRLF